MVIYIKILPIGIAQPDSGMMLHIEDYSSDCYRFIIFICVLFLGKTNTFWKTTPFFPTKVHFQVILFVTSGQKAKLDPALPDFDSQLVPNLVVCISRRKLTQDISTAMALFIFMYSFMIENSSVSITCICSA